MARPKIDGVIEAVRYTPDGGITTVRAYERRGVVWSDRILLGREELFERLKDGKHFVTGARKAYLGSVFETGPTVEVAEEHIVTGGQSASRDCLVGVPVF